MRFLFVFGDAGSGYAGGDMLVYRLANQLAARHDVYFVRLVDWRRTIGPFVDLQQLTQSHAGISVRGRVYESITRHGVLRGLANRVGVTPAQQKVHPLDPRIRVTFYDQGGTLPDGVDHAVATSWMTAYFVDRIVAARHKHYLIQNFEDAPEYSGVGAPLVTPTYALDLHKIVISDALRARFSADEPSVVYPGVDPQVFRASRPFDARPLHSVLLPLKAASYKGTRAGVEAASMSRRGHPDLFMVAFGNRHAAPLAGVRRSVWCRVEHNPDTANLVRWMNASRFLLFPSVVEGFPVTPLEIMASGGLVVSTPNTGTAAYLLDGQNSYVASGFSPTELSEALDRGFDDHVGHPRVLAAAAETVKQYPWERTFRMFSEAVGG